MEERKERGTLARRCETHVQGGLEDEGRPGRRMEQRKDRGTLARKCETRSRKHVQGGLEDEGRPGRRIGPVTDPPNHNLSTLMGAPQRQQPSEPTPVNL